MLLENKIAVVTGAGRGIGRGIALALAREGAMVVVNYNGSKERAEEVVRTIEEAGGKAAAIQCNISDFEAAKEFFANVVKEYGKIDILVNNAGITKDNLMMKMSEEEFQSVIQTNLAGTFHGVKFVTRPMMKQRQGRIINIASVSGAVSYTHLHLLEKNRILCFKDIVLREKSSAIINGTGFAACQTISSYY